MPTNGTIQNLTGLFSTNQIFEVPDFQRNYTWEAKQAEELFNDINRARELGINHFMGGLILLTESNSPNDVIQVVDGQQRLTTLFLLIALIRDRAAKLPIANVPPLGGGAPIEALNQAQSLLQIVGPKPEFRFIPHGLVANLIRERVFHYPDENRKKLPDKHFKYSLNLRKSYKKLASLLDAELKDRSDADQLLLLDGLLYTIRFRLQLLNVQTDNQPEAHEIFMTLNSRGVPLGPSDLVKSEIFKHLTRGLVGKELEYKTAELSGDWKAILDNLENGDVEQFLRHYLVSTQEESVTSKKVFDKVSRIINVEPNNLAKAKIESEALLKELVISSGLYGSLLNGVAEGLPKADLSLRLLSEFVDSYRIFLLAVVDPRIKLDDSDRLELIRLTEVLAFRWTLTGGNAQKLEDAFQVYAVDLRTNRKSIAQIKLDMNSIVPSDEKVRQEFEETHEGASFVRVVLFKLNSLRFPAEAIAYDPKKLHVEHIAPDKSTPEWIDVLFPNNDGIDREVEYEAAVELWGNKLLLDAKINQSVKQKDFLTKARGLDVKYSGYHKSTIQMTVDIANHFDAWDRKEIATRNKWVADSFIAVWSVQEHLEDLMPYSEWKSKNPELWAE